MALARSPEGPPTPAQPRLRFFLIDGDNNLTPLSQADYDSESLLQQLLADHPSLLGGDQMGSGAPGHRLFVTREAPAPDKEGAAGRWSLDHRFLDQDALPTFVEVKRASDSRVRCQVVGQMLDYAANGLRNRGRANTRARPDPLPLE